MCLRLFLAAHSQFSHQRIQVRAMRPGYPSGLGEITASRLDHLLQVSTGSGSHVLLIGHGTNSLAIGD